MTPETWPHLLAVDIEGNGASPPDLIEVATLPFTSTGPDTAAARSWLIQPPHPVTAHTIRVHGLTNQHLADAPTWPTVAPDVRAILDDAWICAHNAHVEYRVLTRHLPDWQPAGVLDTLRLARATHRGLSDHRLDTLIEHHQLDLTGHPGRRHRALYDAYAAAQLLLALVPHYPTWHQLTAAAVPPGLPGAPDTELALW